MAKICNVGLGNTGNARTPQKSVTKKVLFTNYFDGSGNVNTIYFERAGTVATAGSTTVTGTGTDFTRLKVGDPIMIEGETRRYIAAIASATSLTLDVAASTTESGLAYNTFDANYFKALINHTDPLRRLYPSSPVKNATDKRDASITKSYEDQTSVIVNWATRKYSMIIVGKDATPQLAAQLRLGRYSDNELGFYDFDKDGNIWGMLNSPGQLDPRRIDPNTLDVVYNPGDDKTTPEIMIAFDIMSTELDDNIACLASCDTASDVTANIFDGLLSISAVISSLTVTGFQIKLNTIFGSAVDPVTDKGLLITDFKGNTGTPSRIYRSNNTPGDVTITSVTEQTDANGTGTGIYDVVIPTATTGDILNLKIQRDGRDYSAVNIVPITAP